MSEVKEQSFAASIMKEYGNKPASDTGASTTTTTTTTTGPEVQDVTISTTETLNAAAEARAAEETAAAAESTTTEAATETTVTEEATTTEAAAAEATATTNTTEDTTTTTQPETTVATAPAELTDEQVLEYMRKKTGNNDLTLDSVIAPRTLTAEEQAAADEKLRTEATQFALQNNIFSLKDQEAFNVDRNRDAVDIARDVFEAGMRATNPDITQEELTDLFNEEFALDREENDPKRVYKAAQIQQIKDAHILGKYGKILNATDAYKNHQTVQQRAQQFVGNVQATLNELKQPIEIEIKDADYSQKVKFDISQESLDAVAKEIMSPELAGAFGNLPKEQLSSIIRDIARGRNIERFVSVAGDAYYSGKTIAEKAKRQNVEPEIASHGTGAGGPNTQRIPGHAEKIMKQMGTLK